VGGRKGTRPSGSATLDSGAISQAEAVLHLPLPMVVSDLAGNIGLCNRAFEARVGMTSQACEGRNLADLLSVSNSEIAQCMTEVERGHRWNGRWVALLSGGRSWVQDVEAGPLRAEDGKVAGCVAVIRDLTDEDSLVDRLKRVDRMDAMARLAAGVAHEINNPLSFIIGNVQYLQDAIEKASDGIDEKTAVDMFSALEDVRLGAGQISDIVEELNTLVKSGEQPPGPVDLRSLIESTLAMVANQMAHRAVLVREYADAPKPWGNASRLGQVILNLVVNAMESIPAGDAKSNEVRVCVREGLRGNLILEVKDTGSGIPEDVLPHVFDPFFTTKQAGQGAGLGLTIAHEIVRDMGGDITVRTETGRGTSILVSLPIEEPLAGPEPTLRPKASEEWQSNVARILVVDDQPAILRTVRRILVGHEIVACRSGREGLEHLSKSDFDIVFCDLMMPELTGPQFFDLAVEVRPEMRDRFVFITGGAFTAGAAKFLKSTEHPVVEKPFVPQKLRELVKQLVGS
jgi:PAS domain S-box-containing protein